MVFAQRWYNPTYLSRRSPIFGALLDFPSYTSATVQTGLAQETVTLERAVWSYRVSAKRKSGSIYAFLEDNFLLRFYVQVVSLLGPLYPPAV